MFGYRLILVPLQNRRNVAATFGFLSFFFNIYNTKISIFFFYVFIFLFFVYM